MMCGISLERAKAIMEEELDAGREAGERYAMANTIVNLYAANYMLEQAIAAQ